MEPLRRCIASHAADTDYAPLARVLLWKLGYALVPAESAEAPALRVVREERLAEVPPPAAPIILLTQGERARAEDPRVAGAVRRPAGLHALYRLIQSALEETPRSVPRVATSLVARARSAQTEWTLGVRSLSENGCLVEGPELPPLETALRLELELPWGERLATPAVAAYEQGSGLGLVFHGITVAARRRIAKAVVSLLQRA